MKDRLCGVQECGRMIAAALQPQLTVLSHKPWKGWLALSRFWSEIDWQFSDPRIVTAYLPVCHIVVSQNLQYNSQQSAWKMKHYWWKTFSNKLINKYMTNHSKLDIKSHDPATSVIKTSRSGPPPKIVNLDEIHVLSYLMSEPNLLSSINIVKKP